MDKPKVVHRSFRLTKEPGSSGLYTRAKRKFLADFQQMRDARRCRREAWAKVPMIAKLILWVTVGGCGAFTWAVMPKPLTINRILPDSETVRKITILPLAPSQERTHPALISDARQVREFLEVLRAAKPYKLSGTRTKTTYVLTLEHEEGNFKIKVRSTTTEGILIEKRSSWRTLRYRNDDLLQPLLKLTRSKR